MEEENRCDEPYANKIEISDADVVEAIKLIRDGFKMRDVCEYLGFKKTTWYARLEEHPEIVVRFERAKQAFHLELAKQAKELALDGDREMLKFLLTRRFQYHEKHEIEIKPGKGDTEKTREELIEEILKLAKRNKLPFARPGDPEIIH